MALTKVQAGLLEATGTPDATTFLRGDGAWSAPAVAALSTASGSAPSYSARAWVNFNGTGTVAIRASGNVTSITDNGTGNYTVNFTAAMPDINYTAAYSSGQNSAGQYCVTNSSTQTTSALQVLNSNFGAALVDNANMFVSVFR